MNPLGFFIIILGILLIIMGIKGSYKNFSTALSKV